MAEFIKDFSIGIPPQWVPAGTSEAVLKLKS
jgi:hypothetical protein